MHSGKLIALAASLLINACAIALLAGHMHTPAAHAAAAPIATHASITLPTITVYPSAAEWRMLDTGLYQRT